MSGVAAPATPRPQIAYVALQSIGRAIRDLSQPIGTRTITTELGSMTEDRYPIGHETRDRWGVPPRLWPEVIAVTEALIGSALVVAQTHITATGGRQPQTVRDQIWHVANYWKHRDGWEAPWNSGSEPAHEATRKAVVALGATPPIVLGQLQELVEKVLGQPFDVDTLWAAIS